MISTYMGTSLAQNNIYADPSYVGTQGIAIGANSYSDYQGMSMGVGARSKNLSLALGYFSNAEGTSSIATGVGAYAKGDNSISSGRQSSTISTGSVALGVAARGGSTADGGLGGSIAVGAASDATHEQAIAIGGITNANTATLEQGRGDNTQATAARATAIGANAKAQAESSIAFGTKASVGSAGTNAVAIGKDSSATVANGVALGSESKATTAAGVTGFDMADGRSNVYSGLAGTAKTANMAAVSVGDGANKTRQITGVAAGKEDTDAVNVAQLKSTNLKIAGNTTSGGADVRLHDQTLTVKGDGTYLTSAAAGNTITMNLKQDVKDKIDNAANKNLDNLNPAGVQKIKDTAAWNVVANSGTAQKVQGGDTVKFLNGDNIQITQSGKDFTIATKRDVTFDSVTIPTGNVVINNSGINAGNKKITKVANGTDNDDAVNVGQLNAVKNSPMTFGGDSGTDVDRKLGEKLNVKGGATGNLTSNNIAVEANGNDTLNIKLAENVNLGTNGSVKIGDSTLNNNGLTITGGPSITKTGGINAGGNKITNVADGTVGAGSTDAVNGGQLHDVKTSVTNNTTALNNLKSNTIKLSGDSTSTTAERLDKNGGIEFGVKSGDTHYLTSTATGTDITLDLTPDAKAKINKVATLSSNTVSLGGDTGTTNTQALDKTGGIKFNVKGGATGNLTSNNIAVEANGNDTLNIKLAENVNLGTNGSVKIGDSTLNNSGLTITGGPSITKTGGINAGGKTISNVADGTANDHAVNLGQLNNAINNATATATSTEKVVASTAADNIATVAPSTGQNLGDKNATYEVTVSKTAVQNIAKDAAAWNVVANSGTAQKVQGGDTVKFKDGDNIEITQAGKDFTIATKRDVNFNSVTINNGPKLSSTGIDAGNKKITKVDDGTDNDDAVNVGQLNAVKNSPMTFGGDSGTDVDRKLGEKLNVKGGATGNLTSNNIAVEANGNDTLNIKLAENVNLGTNGSVKIGDSTLNNSGLTITGGPSITKTGGINAGGKTISNVADGTANDHAVNLGQLNNAINNATATATSTEKVVASTAADNIATVAPSTGQNLGDKNATYEVTVSKTAVQNIAKDAAAWNVVANSGTAQKVQGGDTVKFKDGDNIEITQAGKDFTIATKRDVNFNSVTINNGPKLSSTGIDAGNKKITKVDDGTDNDDAVNVGQLNAVKNSPMTFGGDSGTDVDRKLGEKLNVKGGATGNLTSNNIAVEANGNDTLNIKLAENVNLGTNGSVKIGDSTLNNNGLTITGGPSITKTGGINAGGNKITNVADGTVGAGSTDAVNGGQLHDVKTSVTNNTTALNNLKSNTIKLSGDSTSTTAERLDKNGGIEFGVKSGDTHYLTSTATGTDITLDLTPDAKAKINKVATLSSNTVSLGGDTGTTNTQALDKTGGIKFNVKGGATGNLTSNNIAVEANGNDTLNIKLAENVNLGTNGSVKIGDSTLNNSGLTITGGPSITKTGGINAGGKTISNVADGTANDHAVNLGQLNNAINNATATATSTEKVVASTAADNIATVAPSTGQNLGDKNATYEVTVSKTAVQNIAKDAAAWNVVANSGTAQKVEGGDTVKFLNGDNIQITQAGKDFTIATKRDVTFDSVTIPTGNVVINNSGINAGGNKITNVADGTVGAGSTDAVNGGQLHDVKTSVTNNTTALNNLKSNTIKLSGDSTSTTAERLDKNGGIEFGVKSGDTHYLTSTATGTDITLDLTPDAKAKINKVATLSSNTVSLGGDTGTTNTQALDKTGGIKFNVKGDGTYLTSNATNDDVTLDFTQATKNKINNAATNKLDNLDPAGIQKIKDTAAWNVVANSGTAEKVEGGNTVKFKDGDNIEITQNGKDFTFATKRNVNFDSVTVPTGNVVINNSGINAGNNKITDVADGTIAPGSKEAVNGGQLHNVQNTINAGAFTVSANGGAKDRIAKDENIDFENADGNIAISYDATGNKFTYNLSPNLNLGPAGSLRIGDALLNNGGLTIVNGPSITSAGVDAGNKKITNVADGTIGAGSKDAINGGQLHDVQTNLQTSINNNAQNIANNTNAINNLNAAVNNPITFTGDSGNNIDRKLGETLNIKGGATGNLTSGNIGVEADSTTNTLNVKLAENIDLGTNGSVKMGDTKINDNGLTINGGPSVTKAGIDAGNKKVTNVANGDITATSKDAVNGSQLHGVADSIKNSIGGNTILNPDGTITTNNIGGTGHNNIHDAIASVNNAANQRTTVVAGDNIDVTVSTNATGGNEYTVATKRDIVVDSVSVANNGPSMNSNGINAGGKTISNLGAGVNPDDAVNVAQLDAVKNSPITFGADTGTDYAATLGSKVNIVGDNKNITTSVNGNNIQVAMSDTPSFGTVNVNDANTGTITGASNVTLDNLDEDGTVGRVATEAQLAAVRNEVTAGTKDIDNKLRGFKRGADAGTASAMAMAGIPQVINPGENAIGASISAYKQQTAVAVGYTRASKNGRAVLKISGSVNSNSELGFSLGFMKGWD